MIEILPYSDKYKEQTIEMVFDILENEFGHHSKSGRPDLRDIPNYYQKNKGNFWLATEDGNIMGTIALSNCGDARGFLERFYVKKDLRRKGIGGKLFSALLDFARGNGYKIICLSTWEDTVAAKNFYTKNGFLRIEFLPNDISSRSGNDNLFYKLEL